MRYILIILVFLSVGAKAQMVIKAHANYRPYAQPAANLLLDDYPNAAAAYSLRKLDKDYTGAAIRVRKDTTGQPEQDIFFVGNELDTAELKSFCLTRDGYITTWYDQSGQGRNATQTTAANQPRIAENGIIIRNPVNNRIVLNLYYYKRFLQTSNQTFAGDITMFGAYNMTVVPNLTTQFAHGIFSYGEEANAKRRSIIIWNGGSGNTWYHYASAFAQNVQIAQATVPTNSLVYSLFNHTSQQISGAYNGGTAVTASRTLTNPAASPIYLAATDSGERLNGNLFELILYNSNQSSNRTGIESNINTYYGIY